MLKTTIKNIYMVFCAFIIAVVVALGVAVMCGYKPKVLVSESMEPEVIRDSLVFVDTHTKLSEVSVGDNIVFDLDGVQILHRAKEIKDGTLIVSGIKGTDETAVDESMFIGRQSVVFPRIGKSFLWLEKNGMWLAISLAVMAILIGCIPWKDENRKVS
ncbi:MAG: hypothetical protein IJ153_04345 [Clostridia bacterium]|nr:hypothetical protein [Clostridia bacterium]